MNVTLVDPDEQQHRDGEWADRMFPKSTLVSMKVHLGKEFDELRAAIAQGDEAAIAEEASDMLGILHHIAHRVGFSLWHEREQKHQVNLARTWLPPDGDGVAYHDPKGDKDGLARGE